MLASTCSYVQSQSFTAKILQDEVQELPADNTAFLTAAREVSIQLDLIAASDANLNNAVVSVVSLDGESRDFEPDANGVVTIDNVQPGPHAIVASSRSAHGTSLLYFKEPVAAVNELPAVKTNARVTMVAMNPETLRPYVEQIAHLSGSPDSVITNVGTGSLYGYRVKLGPQGTLHGRVLSLMKGFDDSALDVGVAGTRIAILRDGQVVANAFSDEMGDFYVEGLSAGVYGCIATSNVGYSAFGFETVGTSGLVQTDADGKRLVSAIQGPAEILPVVLVPNAFIPEVYGKLLEYYPELEPFLDETAFTTGQPIMPYSGMGSGVGGGGGGGGGGVGLGGLGALAGLAAIGAALSNNDDGGIFVQPNPASPATPE
ncbi:MAG: hypothetical protein ACR2NZ_07895 [Rubripirellula sp.]